MPYQSLLQLSENRRYLVFLSTLKHVKTEDILKLFKLLDYDKDGFLSENDLTIILGKEVFNSLIDGFDHCPTYDNYTLDYPHRQTVTNLRDLYPLNDYCNSLMIHHGNKERSGTFSLKQQLSDVINYEENVTKWTKAEVNNPIGLLTRD